MTSPFGLAERTNPVVSRRCDDLDRILVGVRAVVIVYLALEDARRSAPPAVRTLFGMGNPAVVHARDAL